MATHRVSVTLDFCYGHRIRGHAGGCGHLHGHNAVVRVECEGPLDELGMVIDFGDLKRGLALWLATHWDHRMILERDDPLVDVLRSADEPVFVLGAKPTAENLAAHLYGVAKEAGLPVVAVHFEETGGSVATYDGRPA